MKNEITLLPYNLGITILNYFLRCYAYSCPYDEQLMVSFRSSALYHYNVHSDAHVDQLNTRHAMLD